MWFYAGLEERVERILRECGEMGYKRVGLKDLANRVGESPNLIEGSAYRLAPKYDLGIGEGSKRKEPPSSLYKLMSMAVRN